PRDLLPLCRPCHAKVTKARAAAAAKPGEGFVKVTERTLGIDLSAHLPLEAGFRSRLERRSAKPRTTPPLPRVTALERIRVIAEANKDGSGPWEEVIALVVEANRSILIRSRQSTWQRQKLSCHPLRRHVKPRR